MVENIAEEQTSQTSAVGDEPFGPVAAVFLAAGIGSLVLGILTTLAEASDSFASKLRWSESVGPLSGKTITAVGAFLVSWGILALALRRRTRATRRSSSGRRSSSRWGSCSRFRPSSRPSHRRRRQNRPAGLARGGPSALRDGRWVP